MTPPAPRPRRSATRTASSAATPPDVVAFVADPRNLPVWAPDFAATVEPDVDGVWRISAREGSTRRIRVRSDQALGVVDVIAAEDPDLGAFLRALPDGQGSHITFTIVFPGGTSDEDVQSEMAGVERELRNLQSVLG